MNPQRESLIDTYRSLLRSTFRFADKLERQQAVLEFAKAIGFTNARCAIWDCNGDGDPCAAESPMQDMLENEVLPPDTAEHDLGIYLHETAYTGFLENPENEDEPIGKTFDTREQRDAWMIQRSDRAWLIEVPIEPSIWLLDGCIDRWTLEPHKARRFASKADAEKFIAEYHATADIPSKATEYVFADPAARDAAKGGAA